MQQLVLGVTPAFMMIAAALAFCGDRRGGLAAQTAAAAGGVIALIVAFSGPGDGAAGIPLLRADVVSLTMLGLVGLIGWAVLRFTATALAGDARAPRMIGWMALTLGMIQIFVSAGNLPVLFLAWLGLTLGVQRLVLSDPGRAAAVRAARRRGVVALAATLAFAAALAALTLAFGTTGIAQISALARAGEGGAMATAAAALLALAAVLMSAQFPLHGWLIAVVEAPTPVSALLHAGVVNAGGLVLIVFSDVVVSTPLVLAALVMIGGFTALFGSLVMLTQSAVKTGLAWSTVAQMGFMILQCGLSLFGIALLHIVAHSLYKAHAFLSSGGAVGVVAAARRPGPVAVPDWRAVGQAYAIALGLFLAVGWAFGLNDKSPQAVALGAILVLGTAYLVAQGLAPKAPRALAWRTAALSAAASVGYFALQAAADWMTAGTLAAPRAPGPLEWALLTLALVSFGAVAVAQSLFPLWAHHPAAAGLRVHLSNGLYADALVDRMIGSWRTSPRTERI